MHSGSSFYKIKSHVRHSRYIQCGLIRVFPVLRLFTWFILKSVASALRLHVSSLGGLVMLIQSAVVTHTISS